MRARGQSHATKLVARALKRVGLAREFERQRDILERRHRGDEMEGLKHDADRVAAQPGERILVEVRQIRSREERAPAVGFSSPAATMSSEDLPNQTARAAPRFTCFDAERDAAQHRNTPRRTP